MNPKAIQLFETSVTVCQSTRRDISDDLNLQQLRRENPESRSIVLSTANYIRRATYWGRHILASVVCSLHNYARQSQTQ